VYRSNQVRYEYLKENNVDENAEEAKEGDHVWCKPQGQQLHKPIPLRYLGKEWLA
jgi:hypothetical protein